MRQWIGHDVFERKLPSSKTPTKIAANSNPSSQRCNSVADFVPFTREEKELASAGRFGADNAAAVPALLS
jgi:hypothetical protein